MMDILVFDANVLIALFSARSKEDTKLKIQSLIDETKKSRGRILIPAPALSEFAVRARAEEIRLLLEERIFLIAPFDTRSALECGAIYRTWLSRQSKTAPKSKIKFDFQILSIAKVYNANLLITNDNQLKMLAVQHGILAKPIEDIALPDTARQLALPLSKTASVDTTKPSST
jgi:predicted nucleic acid-binding protein